MIILHKDGDGLTNFDNVTRIERNGVYLTAYMIDGSCHHLGRYDSQDKAKLALDQLAMQLEKEYG